MEDIDKVKQRYELLKMARELLNEEYINQRAEDHNKWVAENDELWRTKRRTLPYPPFAQYPTDEDIIKAATKLYHFIYADTDTEVPGSNKNAHEVPQTHTSVFKSAGVSAEVQSVSEIDDVKEHALSVSNNFPDVNKKITVDETKDNRTQTLDNVKKLLPGWVRRSAE